LTKNNLIKKNLNFKSYVFRLGKLSELNKIHKFVKKNWKNGHILGKNKEYFLYQFKDKTKINFYLAINKSSKKIESVHGFLKYSKNKFGGTICGSIATVKEKNSTPFLGLETFKRMINYTKPNLYIGIGTDPETMVPLLKKFYKFETGLMSHYYKLNRSIKRFKIAEIKNKKIIKEKKIKSTNTFFEIFDFSKFKKINCFKRYKILPKKNLLYVKKRFFNHPIFNYRFFIIGKKSKKFRSVLIAREINYNTRKILRFVDFIGDINDLSCLGKFTDDLLRYENFEYIDFICCNLNKKYLTKSGFVLKKKDDKNIIPNYFQPYLKRNIIVNYVSSKKNIVLFKADADQDTPR
jgi:hypothetical protein